MTSNPTKFAPETSIPFRNGSLIPSERSLVCVIQAQNGIFGFGRLMLGDTPLMDIVIKLREYPPDWLDDLIMLENTTKFYFAKAKAEQIGQVISFFRWASVTHDSEAMVLIYFTPDDGGKWAFIPPRQKVSKSRIEWKAPGPTPEGWIQLGSIHSHGTSSAGHSSIDDTDELDGNWCWDGIHITFGNFARDTAQLDISASVVIQGSRLMIKLEDVIDSSPEVQFPSEWINEVIPQRIK